VRATGQKRQVDRIETVITYEHGRGERIQLVSVNGLAPENTAYDLDGAMNIGTVSSQLTSPFRARAGTVFKYAGRERYRNRDCFVFTYFVPLNGSDYRLIFLNQGQTRHSIVVAFSGRMWLDRESGNALRIEKTAKGIPDDFPITDAKITVEFDWVVIAGNRFWLPLRAEAETRYIPEQFNFFSESEPVKRVLYRNLTEFRNYRKFEADVKVVN
jgi:hypothetical protein